MLANTVNGLFTIDNITTLPSIAGLTLLGDTVYGLYNDSGATTIFSLNTSVGTGTVLSAIAIDPIVGSYISLSAGSGMIMSINTPTALKTINGVAPVANNITFTAGDILTTNQTAGDTLTISLAPDVADTNIVRSTQYE